MRQELTPQESAAFEEHYFACDRCFEDVQEMDKFIAGVRQAGRRGLLDDGPGRSVRGWLMPAFVFAAAAVLVLGAALSYLALIRLPAVEAQLRQTLADSGRPPGGFGTRAASQRSGCHSYRGALRRFAPAGPDRFRRRRACSGSTCLPNRRARNLTSPLQRPARSSQNRLRVWNGTRTARSPSACPRASSLPAAMSSGFTNPMTG